MTNSCSSKQTCVNVSQIIGEIVGIATPELL